MQGLNEAQRALERESGVSLVQNPDSQARPAASAPRAGPEG